MFTAPRTIGFQKDQMTVHVFRAIARTLMAEQLGMDDNIIQARRDHSVKDSFGQAYNCTAFVEQRRALMQRWADYLDTLRKGAEVISFKAA